MGDQTVVHYQVLCFKCNGVIRQCRCMDKNKPITYEICDDCGKKVAEKVTFGGCSLGLTRKERQ